MSEIEVLDKIAISVRSHRLLKELLDENPPLEDAMRKSRNEPEALIGVRNWVMSQLRKSPTGLRFYESAHPTREDFEALEWPDFAAIRILDYIDNAGRTFPDQNLRGELAVSNPIHLIWLAVSYGTGGAKPVFFEDMLRLFRQFTGADQRHAPSKAQVLEWMERHPTGLDPRIVHLREENRERILGVIIREIEGGKARSSRYKFEPGLSDEQKLELAREWWKEGSFHLTFAIRTPERLNEMLGHSLDPDMMKLLQKAADKGIPFFVNPYYLSLLHVRVPYFAIGADLAIRDYVFYSEQLVEEFGHIVGWEKEDQVEPGKPNAAGWILPTHNNVHRRYPDVAILIPDTVGRACGGLCASCQRMYDFQSGHLNFDLEKLAPKQTWPEKLRQLMEYFENDSQLRDILITGGDSLMSTDQQLAIILDAIYQMALRKREANEKRPEGEKYAELLRVRLGTRLPVYLPQRITPELVKVLSDFRAKAAGVGIRQFVIQTHFESPLEITPEARDGIQRLLGAGWLITNQHVLTTAASRRGHAAKLRQVLGELGILPYYTFSVKGYKENWHNFATNARAIQEQAEEKRFGTVPADRGAELVALLDHPEKMVEGLADLRAKLDLPFLAADRNVLNLPGVGKSLSFRVIGITRYGRRILEFDHDPHRRHSPIIDKMGKVIIIETKSVAAYLSHLKLMGEDPAEYDDIWGYSLGVTEPRLPIFEYPPDAHAVTPTVTNLELVDA